MALIDYSPGARADLMEACDWYMEKSESAAQSFVERFEEAIRRIEAVPLQFAEIYKDFRRCPVEKFPYSIIFLYQQESSLVSIVAVSHAKRDDRYWKLRN